MSLQIHSVSLPSPTPPCDLWLQAGLRSPSLKPTPPSLHLGLVLPYSFQWTDRVTPFGLLRTLTGS